MSITDYLTITCSLILMWSFGRLFTQSAVMSTLLLGLLVASGIIAITARFMPGYTGALLCTFSLLDISKLVYDAYRHYVNHGMKGCQDIIQRHATPTSLLTTIGYLLFFALYFQSFHYSNVHYEAHDVLYFGPSFEMLKADYLGNLRVPIFYPYELGAYHLLPAAMITAGGFLTHHPTLQYLTEVRYFLAVLFFSDFFRRFYNTLNCKLHWYIAISMASLIIFGPAISQCLTISSFCYVFVLLSILITIFELQQPTHRQSISHQKLLLIFSILLIICKAPLFYIAGIFAFFLWIKLKPHRWRWQVVLTAAIVLGNMSTWVLIPPSYLVKQNAASFHLAHNRTDATALATVTAWFTPPTRYVNLTNNINEHIINTAIVKKEIEKIRNNDNTELAHNIETTFIPAVFFLIYIITSIYALFFYIASRKKKRTSMTMRLYCTC